MPYHSMIQTIDFECSICGDVIFNMPKFEVQKHVTKHKLDQLDEKQLVEIGKRMDWYIQGITKRWSPEPLVKQEGTLPKGWS